MPAPIDLTGHVYNRITVLHETTPTQYPRKWECLCSCGAHKTILGASLRNGLTQSCGCLNKEILSAKGTLHGDSGSRLYGIWHNMKQRCENVNRDTYSFYGALGTSVCPAWNEYIPFKEWAVQAGYNDDLSIDRKDGLLGYSPDNCHWTNSTVQARNQKRRNTNTSGHTGVSYVPRLKKYQAYITIAYKKINLGMFAQVEDALAARKQYIQASKLDGFPTT